MLDKDVSFFRRNKVAIKEKYVNKYIVIHKQQIIGAFDTHALAYESAIKQLQVGTFIIEFTGKK